jgi:F-type H+-transporting ATPase subunit c
MCMKRFLTVVMLLGMFLCLSSTIALASEGAAATGLDSSVKAAAAIAAGLGLGIAAFGGALGQGKGVAAALEGIARNPGASGKIFAPMIIGLALIESLVIYAFVVSLILVGKV